MKKAAPFVLLGVIVIACSSSTSSSPVDAGASADAATPAEGGAGDGATDAGSEAEAAPACATAPCKTQADCKDALGGVAGCWQCKVGCCAPLASGQDPGAACTSNATACTKGVCDGNGGCAKENLAVGTACGMICNPNKADQKVEAKCTGAGVCAIDFLGGPPFSNCPSGTCVGSSDKCNSCPPSGCAVSCADAGSPSCP